MKKYFMSWECMFPLSFAAAGRIRWMQSLEKTGSSRNSIRRRALIAIMFFFVALISFAGEAGKTEKFLLKNGIPVYVKDNKESELCAVYAVISGGVEYLSPETSGLESAVLSLMTMGSKNYSYEELKSFAYETQGGFSSYSINDGSVYGMSCILKYFDKTFARFADSFFYPEFSEREYEILMQGYRQKVAQQMNDPSGMLFYYMNKMIYSGHPYAAGTEVTQDSVDNITLDAIKTHYKTLKDSRRISFVAAGNVDSRKLVENLNKTFGTLTPLPSPLKSTAIPGIKIDGKPVVLVHSGACGAGHALRVFASPEVDSEDYPVARIAANIFSDVLFNVVREKYGICYTPSSSVSSSDAPFGYEFFFRTTNFGELSKALEEAREFMEKGILISGKDRNGAYRTEPLESRLQGYKNSYINRKYSTQNTCGGVASRMAASLLQFGDIDSADALTDIVKNCSAGQVISVFKKYWIDETSEWFAVVGPDEEENVEKILDEM